mmetsp:Transcript_100686/g.307748  ORF Transcript_100686/g.307748 Transcript_100686/m.307748 type:complete len:228 (-) Transcript_100686:9-692(-)
MGHPFLQPAILQSDDSMLRQRDQRPRHLGRGGFTHVAGSCLLDSGLVPRNVHAELYRHSVSGFFFRHHESRRSLRHLPDVFKSGPHDRPGGGDTPRRVVRRQHAILVLRRPGPQPGGHHVRHRQVARAGAACAQEGGDQVRCRVGRRAGVEGGRRGPGPFHGGLALQTALPVGLQARGCRTPAGVGAPGVADRRSRDAPSEPPGHQHEAVPELSRGGTPRRGADFAF